MNKHSKYVCFKESPSSYVVVFCEVGLVRLDEETVKETRVA